jgi:hypothetical protein
MFKVICLISTALLSICGLTGKPAPDQKDIVDFGYKEGVAL